MFSPAEKDLGEFGEGIRPGFAFTWIGEESEKFYGMKTGVSYIVTNSGRDRHHYIISRLTLYTLDAPYKKILLMGSDFLLENIKRDNIHIIGNASQETVDKYKKIEVPSDQTLNFYDRK